MRLWIARVLAGSASQMFIGASNQLGEFESGATAALIGVIPAVVVGGVATCCVVVLWSWFFPSLRTLDALPKPAEDATAPGT